MLKLLCKSQHGQILIQQQEENIMLASVTNPSVLSSSRHTQKKYNTKPMEQCNK